MSIPRRLRALAAVGIAGLMLPVIGLIVRTSWGRVLSDIGDASSAVRVSLTVSVIAVTLAVLTGVPIGWVLARSEFRGRSALRAMVLLPIVLPPVVSGVALLAAFGRSGTFGRWLTSAFSISLPFTMTGAVVAAAFVAIPFVALVAEAGSHFVYRRVTP